MTGICCGYSCHNLHLFPLSQGYHRALDPDAQSEFSSVRFHLSFMILRVGLYSKELFAYQEMQISLSFTFAGSLCLSSKEDQELLENPTFLSAQIVVAKGFSLKQTFSFYPAFTNLSSADPFLAMLMISTHCGRYIKLQNLKDFA